jgi:hypothetical protein
MEAESILAAGEKEYSELKHQLWHVRDESAALGAYVHFHLVSPVKTNFGCSENVTHAVVVGSDGNLSPCVMKQIPERGENYHYFKGQKHLQLNRSYGNIQQESLNTIWHRNEYQQFIHKIRSNVAPISCQNCLKAYIDDLV